MQSTKCLGNQGSLTQASSTWSSQVEMIRFSARSCQMNPRGAPRNPGGEKKKKKNSCEPRNLFMDLIIQNKLNIGRYLCLSSRSFINFDMQHGERWPAFSLNRIISPAVSSDYNHVDLKNSMTVALDFYTLFSKTVYIYYMLWSYCIFNTACACK